MAESTRQHYDVIVIGAGVAGGAVAGLLAAAGARVLLLERQRYPHDKLCGEFLSPETEGAFRRLGVWPEIVRWHPPRLTEALITAPNGAILTTPLPGAAVGFSRWRLDPLLASHAMTQGARFEDGCDVTEVSGSFQAGFSVSTREGTTLRARVVLGAWGKRATLDRALQRPFFAHRSPFLGLKAHFEGIDTGQRIELHGFPDGYVGMSAIEGGLTNVCLLTTERRFAIAGRDPARFLEELSGYNQAIRDRMAGARRVSGVVAISQIAFRPKDPVEHDIVMLGDTAALISPLAGNGMAMALRAAELATPLVLRFLADGDGAALARHYTTAWQREFRTRLMLGQLLQPLFLRPPLLALGLGVAGRVPALARWLVEGTRGVGAIPEHAAPPER